jgi:hypothetical protein
MTATLQEDSQGRDKDGESIKGVERLMTNNKRGGGTKGDYVQDLDSTV